MEGNFISTVTEPISRLSESIWLVKGKTSELRKKKVTNETEMLHSSKLHPTSLMKDNEKVIGVRGWGAWHKFGEAKHELVE